MNPGDSLEWRAEVRRYRQAQPLLESLRHVERDFHIALTAARVNSPAEKRLEAAFAHPPLFVLAVHEWGYQLGEKLFDQVQLRRLTPAALRTAFKKKFTAAGEGRRELRRLMRVAGNPARA